MLNVKSVGKKEGVIVMQRKFKTKKEINQRIYEIFNSSNTESVSLTPVESARVKELLWIQGIDG